MPAEVRLSHSWGLSLIVCVVVVVVVVVVKGV